MTALFFIHADTISILAETRVIVRIWRLPMRHYRKLVDDWLFLSYPLGLEHILRFIQLLE